MQYITCVLACVIQDNNKRALVTEQDRAQLEMQIQTFKQSRGLLSLTVITQYSEFASISGNLGNCWVFEQGI